jgi:LPS O-antigen subunit length determinant protein (WzzB/FepE family)
LNVANTGQDLIVETDAESAEVSKLKEVLGVNPGQAYQNFLDHLQSRSLRYDVFIQFIDKFDRKFETNAERLQSFSGLNNSLILHTKGTKEKDLFHECLELEGQDPQLISGYLNALAQKANDTAAQELIFDLKAKKKGRLLGLRQQIENLTLIAEKKRHDEIVRLTERDVLERNEILAKIAALRKNAQERRLAEIARLEEQDEIQRRILKEKIENLLKGAEKRKLDKVKRLEEAALIARNAGIVERGPLVTGLSAIEKQLRPIEIKTEVNPQKLPPVYVG